MNNLPDGSLKVARQTFVSLIALICFSHLVGCATGYRHMQPEKLKYDSAKTESGLKVAYSYNPLRSFKNRRYGEHEHLSKIKVVALSVTNNTGRTINLAQDAEFSVNGEKATPLTWRKTSRRIRQITPLYFVAHAPLLLVLPEGLYVYAVTTTANTTRAIISNQKMKQDLQRYRLDTNIKNGQTMSILAGFKGFKVYGTLNVKLKK